MATAVRSTTETSRTSLLGEQRVVLPGIGWAGYETLLAMVGDGHVRLTCDGKDVELMSPLSSHEQFKKLIARLIEMLTFGLNIPCEGAGSTTFKKPLEEHGLEPDECYYLANSARIIGVKKIDLDVDPPPDLAIEVEITRSALNRMKIYATMGVAEVWRFDGESLRIMVLRPDRTYAEVDRSPTFPFLPLDEFVAWVHRGQTMSQTAWIREFHDWVRDTLAPGLGG